MNIIQSVILGLAQGLGEFLPISSSGHLVILPWFFNFKDPGLGFDVALHWGTLVAVLAYFWKDWIRMVKALFIKSQNGSVKQDRKMLGLIVVASVPGAIFGYLLDDWAEPSFRATLLIAATLVIMGLVLGWSDKVGRKKRSLAEIGLWDSILIGISQAIAIVPGISRSGATISMALFRNINREAAARFSFLLSTPIIFGAGLIKVPELLHEGISASVVIGALVAAFLGFLSIKYLLRYIQTKNYFPFVWYRIALALVIVVVYFLR